MRKHRSCIIFILLIFLTGCSFLGSGTSDYWIGRSVNELESEWGRPDQSFTNERKGRILIYSRTATVEVMTGARKQFSHPGDALVVEVTEKRDVQQTFTFLVSADGTIVGQY